MRVSLDLGVGGVQELHDPLISGGVIAYLPSKGSGEVARVSATQTLNSIERFFFSSNHGGFGSVEYTFYLPSDHAALTCYLHIARPEPVRMKISLRKLHDIDLNSFRTDI